MLASTLKLGRGEDEEELCCWTIRLYMGEEDRWIGVPDICDGVYLYGGGEGDNADRRCREDREE